MADNIQIRSLNELDISGVVRLDEKLSGKYQPEIWENRIVYYLRRDPEAPKVAEKDGHVVGFMLGEVRSGEFGLDEPTGWIEVMGVDPDCRGQSIGRSLLNSMIEHFRFKGAHKVRTLVDERMPGISAFFAATGFQTEPIKALALDLED